MSSSLKVVVRQMWMSRVCVVGWVRNHLRGAYEESMRPAIPRQFDDGLRRLASESSS